jgi:hypothetical protein
MSPRDKRGPDSPSRESCEELKQIIEVMAGARDFRLAEIAIMRARRNDWRAVAERIRNGKGLGDGRTFVADNLERDTKRKKGKTGRPSDFVRARRALKIAIEMDRQELKHEIVVAANYQCTVRTVFNSVEKYGPDASLFNRTLRRTADSFKPPAPLDVLRDALMQDDDAMDVIWWTIRGGSEEGVYSVMMCCILLLAKISPT